jgi:hypothetical protein
MRFSPGIDTPLQDGDWLWMGLPIEGGAVFFIPPAFLL